MKRRERKGRGTSHVELDTRAKVRFHSSSETLGMEEFVSRRLAEDWFDEHAPKDAEAATISFVQLCEILRHTIARNVRGWFGGRGDRMVIVGVAEFFEPNAERKANFFAAGPLALRVCHELLHGDRYYACGEDEAARAPREGCTCSECRIVRTAQRALEIAIADVEPQEALTA